MNACIDIETLSLRDDAHILSIGVVKFDNESINERFQWITGFEDQGRHVDLDTVRWWMDQPNSDQFNTAAPGAFHNVLRYVLHQVRVCNQIWADSFDFRVLRNAVHVVPWSYQQERDVRTIKDYVKVERTTEHHTALGDAMHNAKTVLEFYKRLGI